MNNHPIHGDQSTTEVSHYYCSSCDCYMPEEHFFNPDKKCCDHWAKYDYAIKMLSNSVKTSIGFGRSMETINIFTLKK